MFHDTHQAWTPCCNERHLFTDSPSMIREAQMVGATDPFELLSPIEALFQGERTKIFVVRCKCGKEYLSFIDVVNLEAIARARNDILPYHRELEGDLNFQKRYLTPQRRDVCLTKEQFAARVSREKNHMVREALERKCDAAGLGIPWVRSRRALGFAPQT